MDATDHQNLAVAVTKTTAATNAATTVAATSLAEGTNNPNHGTVANHRQSANHAISKLEETNLAANPPETRQSKPVENRAGMMTNPSTITTRAR